MINQMPISNYQAVQSATDAEAVNILLKRLNALETKTSQQASQIDDLKANLQSLMSILKYSSAESSDKEISSLLSDFYQNWPRG